MTGSLTIPAQRHSDQTPLPCPTALQLLTAAQGRSTVSLAPPPLRAAGRFGRGGSDWPPRRKLADWQGPAIIGMGVRSTASGALARAFSDTGRGLRLLLAWSQIWFDWQVSFSVLKSSLSASVPACRSLLSFRGRTLSDWPWLPVREPRLRSRAEGCDRASRSPEGCVVLSLRRAASPSLYRNAGSEVPQYRL